MCAARVRFVVFLQQEVRCERASWRSGRCVPSCRFCLHSRRLRRHPVPEMTPEASAQLQARAFMRACQDVTCAGAPILDHVATFAASAYPRKRSTTLSLQRQVGDHRTRSDPPPGSPIDAGAVAMASCNVLAMSRRTTHLKRCPKQSHRTTRPFAETEGHRQGPLPP